MRVIAVLNQKGGSGKTTTTVNLASSLTTLGQKVLLIDLDPQASSSHWYGHKDKGRALYNLLTDELTFEEAIESTLLDQLSIIPSSPLLSGVEKILASELAAESILKNKFKQVADPSWDFILIDCPPTLSILTLNALTFANEVLIPVETHVMALSGLVQLLKTINLVKERLNPNLSITGIVPCRVDFRTNHSQEVVAQLKGRFADKLCKTMIRENVRLAEAPLHMKPINLYDPHCNGTKDYKMLAEELLGIESIPEVPRVKQPRAKKIASEETEATQSEPQHDLPQEVAAVAEALAQPQEHVAEISHIEASPEVVAVAEDALEINVEKPFEQVVEAHTEAPVEASPEVVAVSEEALELNAEKPVEQVAEAHVEAPVEASPEVVAAAEEALEINVETPVEQVPEAHVETPVEASPEVVAVSEEALELNAETPVEQVAEANVEAPVEASPEAVVAPEEAIEFNLETPVEQLAEAHIEASVEALPEVVAVAEDALEINVETSVEHVAEVHIEAPVETLPEVVAVAEEALEIDVELPVAMALPKMTKTYLLYFVEPKLIGYQAMPKALPVEVIEPVKLSEAVEDVLMVAAVEHRAELAHVLQHAIVAAMNYHEARKI
jgi:chromosome partitioning protein